MLKNIKPVSTVSTHMESTAAALSRSKVSLAGDKNGNQPDTIRLAVVDRFPIVRQGIRRMLAAVPDIVVIAEADHGEAVVDVLLKRPADVLLIDPELGQSNTQNILNTISYRLPDLNIVIFAAFCRDIDIDLAMQIGVRGYLMKSTQAVGLVTTIRRAARQLTCFCDEATARMISWDARSNATSPVSRLATLTDRETDVLRLISNGLATKIIAQELRISSKTVDNHRTRIMTKLNIHDRVELCRFAVREGIIIP